MARRGSFGTGTAPFGGGAPFTDLAAYQIGKPPPKPTVAPAIGEMPQPVIPTVIIDVEAANRLAAHERAAHERANRLAAAAERAAAEQAARRAPERTRLPGAWARREALGVRARQQSQRARRIETGR